jgi:hypothetical protein
MTPAATVTATVLLAIACLVLIVVAVLSACDAVDQRIARKDTDQRNACLRTTVARLRREKLELLGEVAAANARADAALIRAKLDPDTPVDTRLAELTAEVDDARRREQRAERARVEAEVTAVWAAFAKARQVVEEIEADPAGPIVRPVDMGRWV